MKHSLIVKNRAAQSLVLASALIIGLPGLAYAHEDTSDQDAAVQRPALPDSGTDNRDGSTRKEGSTMIRNPNQGPGADRNGRAVDRPSQDWGDRADDHGGGH